MFKSIQTRYDDYYWIHQLDASTEWPKWKAFLFNLVYPEWYQKRVAAEWEEWYDEYKFEDEHGYTRDQAGSY